MPFPACQPVLGPPRLLAVPRREPLEIFHKNQEESLPALLFTLEKGALARKNPLTNPLVQV